MKKATIATLLFMSIVGCSESPQEQSKQTRVNPENKPAVDAQLNPLLSEWDTPFGIPPFEKIKSEHFEPAFDQAIASWREDIAEIASLDSEPTFENTVVAIETSGKALAKVNNVFSNITGTDSDDTLRALEIEIYPELSRLNDAIFLNEVLFSRVKDIYNRRESLGLDQQDQRLLELTYKDFVRAGADLSATDKDKLKEINAEISSLTTTFSQNLLAETKGFEMIVEKEEELAGLSPQMINSAKVKAEAKGLENAWLFSLDRATYEGFMTNADNRRLRKIMFDGYRARGAQGNEYDNQQILIDIAKLRAQKAALLGYETFADLQLESRMAKTPENTIDFLLRLWEPSLQRAREERAEMQAIVNEEGQDFKLAGHDWWYYAEKLRGKKYAFDESQVKPYFELNNVINGAFHVANQLFGLEFEELTDVPRWHPKVKVYNVTDKDGQHLGVFMADYYSRDSKGGGAWMSEFRSTSSVGGKVIRPLVSNNLNYAPPAEGDPTLLSFDQLFLLFHEFGHALQGLMTTGRYARFSGTSGPRDYTEFPAQFMEHYVTEPEVLKVFAKHYQTGEILPQALVDKLKASSTHNTGFRMTTWTAASLLDMAWYTMDMETVSKVSNAMEFDEDVMDDYGILEEMDPRYRSTYFAHIFSGIGWYEASYYAYLWSEILDADAFAAFKETGDIYNKALAKRIATYVYEAGALEPADVLYRKFRGKDPTIEPLLEKRGLQ